MRFEIVKAELQNKHDAELRKMAAGLGVAIGKRPAMIDALCWIFAPRGPQKKRPST